MRRAGVEIFFDSTIIAVMGLVEVLRHWGDIKRAMAIVRAQLEQTRPDLLVLVDYPEFNLKMARHAGTLGIPVLFYISPQVWAWRPKRIHKIGRLIDHMAVIFQFEKKYYEDAGIPVSFVGHPLVDKVKISANADSMRPRLGISAKARVVGLFPGSRHSEIERLLPMMFATAAQMQAQDPQLRFVLPVAATLDFDDVSRQAKSSGVEICVTRDEIYDVINCCDAIVTCSGTVTLEIALLGVPMCIVYKASPLSYMIIEPPGHNPAHRAGQYRRARGCGKRTAAGRSKSRRRGRGIVSHARRSGLSSSNCERVTTRCAPTWEPEMAPGIWQNWLYRCYRRRQP